LAIHTSGSVDAFVDEMNRRAQSLGMSSTKYHTPHGLPPGGGKQPDISTAYDVALLSLAALRHKDMLRYSGTSLTYLPLTPIRDQKFMLANRNALVKKHGYPGCDGLKTGYHSQGGFSLTATAIKNGQRVVAVALGCPDKATRTKEITKLLNNGFQALAK
jgi:D-alanyl-D-alanine carboxypeptidase (penicillin-binding protein 5/6)